MFVGCNFLSPEFVNLIILLKAKFGITMNVFPLMNNSLKVEANENKRGRKVASLQRID